MLLFSFTLKSFLFFCVKKGEKNTKESRQTEGKSKEREGTERQEGEGAEREESQTVRGEIQSKVSERNKSRMQMSLEEPD